MILKNIWRFFFRIKYGLQFLSFFSMIYIWGLNATNRCTALWRPDPFPLSCLLAVLHPPSCLPLLLERQAMSIIRYEEKWNVKEKMIGFERVNKMKDYFFNLISSSYSGLRTRLFSHFQHWCFRIWIPSSRDNFVPEFSTINFYQCQWFPSNWISTGKT